jgi:hypothetical protein
MQIQGARGPVVTYGAIEITGRAEASSKIEIRARSGEGEFALLGTTISLPPTDPYLQPKAAPDGTSGFAFRTFVSPGTYVFEVRLQSSSREAASNLSLTDLVSGEKYLFDKAREETGRFLTPHSISIMAPSGR